MNLKLSKTSLLLITIGVFVIILSGLGVVRAQQVRQQGELNEKLTQAETKLNAIHTESLSQRQVELEQQLSQTKAQSEAARTKLSQPVKSLTISDIIFDTAAASSVTVIEISSPGITNTELAGVPCSALSFTVLIQGEVTDLVKFITALNNNLATGVVNSVEINVPETPGEKKPSANIQMVVYSYRGD